MILSDTLPTNSVYTVQVSGEPHMLVSRFLLITTVPLERETLHLGEVDLPVGKERVGVV